MSEHSNSKISSQEHSDTQQNIVPETPRTALTSTPPTPSTKRLKEKKETKPKDKEKKKKKRKDVEIHRIPGVRRIALSELSQKIVGCIVGEHVTSEKPWIYVKKELIEDNLELHDESSQFLPIRNEILAYPRKEILIGFIPEETGDADEFYICTTEAATDAVQTLITEQQEKQQTRLENAIHKIIKTWFTLGSEKDIDESLPRTNRALLEVEIESKYPILPLKIQFRLRNAEKTRDGYMELITKDDAVFHVFRKRIDNETQVTPVLRDNQAQTICTYPSNVSTQYEYTIDIDENVWKSYGTIILNYLRKNVDNLTNALFVNRNINLYLDDYQILSEGTNATATIRSFKATEYMSFNDVQMCKGKMVSCAQWHQMITGVVAISYADVSANIYLKKNRMIDEVTRAVHGKNPVLIWSFVDALKPRLILESNKEITTISICPFNEDLIIGGASNGQIIIWDIRNRIQRVEDREILTNAQTKYRSYMRSLMGWMKDIYNIKVVRTTAISDLRQSHTGAVNRIQWVSPFEEIGRTGKISQYFEDSEERSLQFMTAGEDGVVLIWDLLRKPTISSGGFRERRLKRLKQRPAGLSSEVSPFRILHLNLKPIYKINILHPTQSRLLPMSMICYQNLDIVYELKEDQAKSGDNISERQFYQARPVYPNRLVISKILMGTLEGQFAEACWEGRDFDLGAIVNSENCFYSNFNSFHDGPIFTISEHPERNLILTTGGKMFAIWSSDFKERPVVWRRCSKYYTHGSWYKHFPSRLLLLRSDGHFESWCLTISSKKPNIIFPMASTELLHANTHPRILKNDYTGISDSIGNYRIFDMKGKDLTGGINEGETVSEFIAKEVQRKKAFLNWQKQWCERHIKIVPAAFADQKLEEELIAADDQPEQEEDKKVTVKLTEDTDPRKRKKPATNRYLEWIREKELAKEQERIKKMILKKKSLDTQQLEIQRKPLLKLEEEKEMRRKKQKARIKGSETIFKDTVAMLFPAIVKEKPVPLPDPYAGGDPIEDKRKCYAFFEQLSEEAKRYINNTKIRIDFSWKNVLQEGRDHRKYLDNTFSRATHYQRFNSYKNRRKTISEAMPYYDSIQIETRTSETSIGSSDQDV